MNVIEIDAVAKLMALADHIRATSSVEILNAKSESFTHRDILAIEERLAEYRKKIQIKDHDYGVMLQRWKEEQKLRLSYEVVLQTMVDVFDMRYDLFTNDNDLAENLYDRARKALVAQ